MANPQVENGFTRIANELLEALCKIRIPGEANQVFHAILRKTYGYGKTEDRISLSQLAELTGIKRPNVCSSLKKLVEMNMIVRNEDNYITAYSINKDFETWKPVPKKILVVPKEILGSPQRDTKTSPQRDTYKRKKETITKEIAKSEFLQDEFNFINELQKLKESTRKDYKIIALYWKKKEWTFENRDQFNAAFRRELRAAKDLKGYTGEQIAKSIAYCQKEYPNKWTLETVFKRITDLINKYGSN